MVKGLDKFIMAYIWSKLRIISLFGITFYLLFLNIYGTSAAGQYIIGFAVGSINFIILSVGFDITVSSRFKNAVFIQYLFFILRYLLIILAVSKLVMPEVIMIFAFGIGLLTNNFSIILSSWIGNALNEEG
jgi:hypothetical protein